MEEKYNVLEYPEGIERVEKEMLDFLPEDKAEKDWFMNELLLWMIQW